MAGQDEIVSKTKNLAFMPSSLSDPYTTHGGGGENSIAGMTNLDGKELQESYRSGFGQSAEYTQKVTGR